MKMKNEIDRQRGMEEVRQKEGRREKRCLLVHRASCLSCTGLELWPDERGCGLVAPVSIADAGRF